MPITMKDLLKNAEPLPQKYNNIFVSRRKEKKIKLNFLYSNALEIDIKEEMPQTVLDNRSKKNFEYQRSIDLHRNTKDEAFQLLIRFFLDAIKNELTKVIVITGGNKLKRSVLREAFLEWIKDAFRIYISAYSEAHIKDGGEGAFYVVLRKTRNNKKSLYARFTRNKK